ncbi:MAG: MMPL family transporter [Oscillospiraceae bacterium]|nr:MMPL family transporter [Oscillospiraceae bacterium]
MEATKGKGSAMLKVAEFIVDKRNLFFLLFAILFIFTFFSRNWVQVEDDLASYLPADSETRQGLDLMEKEFVTFGSAQVMVANISYPDAEELSARLNELPGVQSVDFDHSLKHYNDVSALYDVTFDYPQENDKCLEALDTVKAYLGDRDTFVSTSLGNAKAEIIQREVSVIMVLVAVIVVAVLLFTSQTWAEVPVLLLTFVSAMILNIGTNFLLGTISFVSNSVTSILQLALSLDYAVIFCNRYKEESQKLDIREAAIVSLSKAIPEIGASSLTTIGGLVAMLFMQFGIGADMGICLIKAILLSLVSVFTFMPGLLVLFGPMMERSVHRSFIPKIPFVGKFAYATRALVPPLFIVLIAVGIHFSSLCPYAYGYAGLVTPVENENQLADRMIDESFDTKNMVALVVPAGDYARERALLDRLEACPEVDSTVGLSNTEAMNGYMLTDKLTPRQFSELISLDYEKAQLIYAAYAASQEDYGKLLSGVSTYGVPLMDMLIYVYEQARDGYISIDDQDTWDTLSDAYTRLYNGKLQLQGSNYSRMLVYLNLPEDDDETYAFLDSMRESAESFYPDGEALVVGNSTNDYDFKKSFSHDNTVVSVVSILIVLGVLLFTFKSAGMPLLLILVIQGSIWLNFSFPTLLHSRLFFMGYLVVSSIQMGANIDYAIVIASRYSELKHSMDQRSAIIETMNFAFPTIITSGTILAIAGVFIGQMTSEPTICGIGQCIGRGTVISIFLVMLVLPQILLIGSGVIDKTSFSMPGGLREHAASGRIILDGVVSGRINGSVTGVIHATVDGDVDVKLLSGSAEEAKNNEKTE